METLNHDGSAGELSTSHQEYLLACHGTLDLIPLPTESPQDPLNWHPWRKNINILLVSFHAMMCLFMGAGIIPAYENLALEMNISLQSASYLTSIQIIVLGSESATAVVKCLPLS